jgi:hypothetical protein
MNEIIWINQPIIMDFDEFLLLNMALYMVDNTMDALLVSAH